MKNCIVLFVLLFISSALQAQSLPLPAVRQGKWFLIDGKKEIPLPQNYSSVGLFDKKGTACFSQLSKYGILGRTGKELIPANYFSIVSLGNGYYECSAESGTELLYMTETETRKIICDSVVQLQPAWIYFEKDTNRFLLNTIIQKEIPLQDQIISNARYDYLLLYADSAHISLLNPNAKVISEDTVYLSESDYYFEYHTAKLHIVVDQKGTFEIPLKAQNVWTSEDRIHYSLNGMVYLLDRETRSVLASTQGESIAVNDKETFMITRNGLLGLMDKSGKMVLPAIYSSIWKSTDHYQVSQNGKAGLVDLKFQKIVPCEFRFISCDQKFIYTFSVIDTRGLYSRITGKEILKALYDKVLIENTIIKAWSGSNLSIIEITPEHQVKSKFLLDNAISLKAKTYIANREKIDYRLFSIGWFCDSIITKDSLNKNISVNYKWGIKTAGDSVLVKPRYKQPLFVTGAPVSLVKLGYKAVKGPGFWDDVPDKADPKMLLYSLINFSSGKSIPEFKVVDLDSTDFSSYGFSRFAHSNGNAILRSDGTILKLANIDHSDDENVRVCYSGKEILTEKKGLETVEIMSRTFNLPAQPVSVSSKSKTYRHVKYENARWNFLDSSGNALFKDSFTFAQKFYKQTAIVKSDAGWGVVRKDSVVIPLTFTAIERLPQYNDTVFKVMTTSPGRIYFDTLFRPLAENPGKFEKQVGNIAMYSINGKTRILGKNYETILEEKKPFYLYDFNRFSTKTKKVYEIYDGEGKSLGESAAKPDEFLDEDFFTSGNDGKIGLMSVNGDTIAPFIFSSIVKMGNVFLAEGRLKSNVYDADGTLIKSVELTTILIDSLSGNRAEISEGKINLFDAAGNKMGKFKSELRFKHYFNGHLFSEDGNHIVSASDGKEILSCSDYSGIQFFENGFYAVLHKDKKWMVYDAERKAVAADIGEIKKVKSLGDNVLSLQVKSKFFLLDLDSKEVHKGYGKINGNWENGLLLVASDQRKAKWNYINRDFVDPFKRSFSRAKPFANGYACIADASGWTIIGLDGLPKSLPSYGELEQTGHKIFRMNALPTYGLIDSYGKVIIEPIYEKITLLPDNLIQVIKNGQIGYFDYSGKVIYKIQ